MPFWPELARIAGSEIPRIAEFSEGIGLVRKAIGLLGESTSSPMTLRPPRRTCNGRALGPERRHAGDIHELSVSDIPYGVDLLTAAFLCIDLSLADNCSGLSDRHSRTLWPFLDSTDELCPGADAHSARRGFGAALWTQPTDSSRVSARGSYPRRRIPCSSYWARL